jgi:hypothetical protein
LVAVMVAVREGYAQRPRNFPENETGRQMTDAPLRSWPLRAAGPVARASEVAAPSRRRGAVRCGPGRKGRRLIGRVLTDDAARRSELASAVLAGGREIGDEEADVAIGQPLVIRRRLRLSGADEALGRKIDRLALDLSEGRQRGLCAGR